ncbi:hypothetical protein ON010_g242 [Phytophthora cinnamomi]|nr:hypothetical protein ON010_g242 [Phytophthora cinnamomi]
MPAARRASAPLFRLTSPTRASNAAANFIFYYSFFTVSLEPQTSLSIVETDPKGSEWGIVPLWSFLRQLQAPQQNYLPIGRGHDGHWLEARGAGALPRRPARSEGLPGAQRGPQAAVQRAGVAAAETARAQRRARPEARGGGAGRAAGVPGAAERPGAAHCHYQEEKTGD